MKNVMSVYVIKSAMNICKIGISSDPEKRLRNLLTAHGLGLDLVHVEIVESGRAELVERAAHKMLDRVRSKGEWFRVSEEKAIHAVRVAAWIVADCEAALSRPEKKPKRNSNKKWMDSRRTTKPGDPEALREWARANLVKRKGSRIRTSELYDIYVADCKAKNVDHMSLTAFGRTLPEMGFPKMKVGGNIWCTDLSIAQPLRAVK